MKKKQRGGFFGYLLRRKLRATDKYKREAKHTLRTHKGPVHDMYGRVIKNRRAYIENMDNW